MEEIIESIINGQRKQALTQLSESAFTFEDLAQEVLVNFETNELLTMLKVAIRIGYLREDNLNDSLDV